MYFNDIENDTLHIDTTGKLGGKKSLFVNKTNQATQPYAVPLPPKGTKWLRVSGDFITPGITWDFWKMPQYIITFKQDDIIIKSKFVRIHRIMESNIKKHIVYDVKIPSKTFNHIEVSMWNAGGTSTTYMDNLQVDILE